ncbi:MAG: FixH family protein [Chloroflexi bacterium]|nr:FixH family protein [Chloroflexota bacterium]
MIRRLLLLSYCLLLLLPACQPEPGDGKLTVVFPLETSELAGGQLLRVTITLMDNDGQPVEGAVVQAELRAPDGSVFTTIPCADTGQGRYLADYVTLPLRGAGGTWRVTGQATWGEDQQAHGERTFKGLASLSENLQQEYGFCVEIPRSYDCANRSLQHTAEHHEDGSGRVLINNHCHGSICLNVYWQHADLPADSAAAIAIARKQTASLQPNTGVILDHEELLDPNLVAEQTTFKGQPAWHVTGQVHGVRDAGGEAGFIRSGTIEWMILRCPNSPQDAARDWLWSVVIMTTRDSDTYRRDLRDTRDTFECPSK